MGNRFKVVVRRNWIGGGKTIKVIIRHSSENDPRPYILVGILRKIKYLWDFSSIHSAKESLKRLNESLVTRDILERNYFAICNLLGGDSLTNEKLSSEGDKVRKILENPFPNAKDTEEQ